MDLEFDLKCVISFMPFISQHILVTSSYDDLGIKYLNDVFFTLLVFYYKLGVISR